MEGGKPGLPAFAGTTANSLECLQEQSSPGFKLALKGFDDPLV